MGDGYSNFLFLIVLKRQLFYVDGDRRFEYHCLLIVILIFTHIRGLFIWRLERHRQDRRVVSCLAAV